MSDHEPKSQSEAEEDRKQQNHPGKVPGEGSGPAEADPGATDTGNSDDAPTRAETEGADSSAEGDGPSGGAPPA